MRFLNFAFAMLLVAVTTPTAYAQVVTAIPGTNCLAVVTGPSSGGGICAGLSPPNQTCISPSVGIPLDNYATSSAVASQFASVNSQLTTANGQIDTLNSQLGTTKGQISALNNQLGTVNGQIGTLNSQVGTANSQIGTLNTRSPL